MDCPELETGDIVCFADSSWLSRTIKWFTRHGDEPKTKCSHIGMMFDPDRICEALAHVKIHAVKPRLDDGWREVYRPIGLTDNDRAKMIDQMIYYKGKRYGWWKNLAQAADGLIGGRYFFRRLLWIDNYPICSWLVAWVYKRFREYAKSHMTDSQFVASSIRLGKDYYFGVPPNAATPDDIHDACQDKRRFTRIYTTEA